MPKTLRAEPSDTSVDSLRKTGEKITLSDEGLAVWKPDGWVRRPPADGAVLTLNAAGRETIRLEVRVERDLDDEAMTQFFSSFHAKLLGTGFSRLERKTDVRYGDNTGVETVYKVRSGDNPYRLIIWQIPRGDAAWMVVAFLPEARLKYYRETYEQFASTLDIDATGGEVAGEETPSNGDTGTGDAEQTR